MARGATWDPDLEERIGDAIGRELRAIGANLYGGVCVNVLRHPAWGRAQETYGEDPHHVGELGAALDPRPAAPRDGVREALRVQLDGERALLASTSRSTRSRCTRCTCPHFSRIVDEGVASVMSAYNSVNGEWCGQNRDAAHRRPARRVGLRGVRDQRLDLRAPRRGDVGRPPASTSRCPTGWSGPSTSPARSSAARRRGTTSTAPSSGSSRPCCASTTCCQRPTPACDVLGSPEHRALAREAAARSVVLLRNEPVDGAPVLPLAASAARAGRGARPPRRRPSTSATAGRATCGTSTCLTVLDGLRRRCPASTSSTTTAPTSRACRSGRRATPTSPSSSSATPTSTKASTSATPASTSRSLMPETDEPDVVERFDAETDDPPRRRRPGARARPARRGRVQRAAATARRCGSPGRRRAHPRRRRGEPAHRRRDRQAGSAVVVTRVGSTRSPRSCSPGTRAWRAATRSPTCCSARSTRRPSAVQRTRRRRPTSRRSTATPTPFVYDRWHGWWHLARDGSTPAFPFGFGLGYTTFALDDAVGGRRATTSSRCAATVRNTGDRDGTDVVQVYSADPPRLVGFARVEIAAGDAHAVEIVIPFERFAVRDATRHAMVVRPGATRCASRRSAADAGIGLEVDVSPA